MQMISCTFQRCGFRKSLTDDVVLRFRELVEEFNPRRKTGMEKFPPESSIPKNQQILNQGHVFFFFEHSDLVKSVAKQAKIFFFVKQIHAYKHTGSPASRCFNVHDVLVTVCISLMIVMSEQELLLVFFLYYMGWQCETSRFFFQGSTPPPPQKKKTLVPKALRDHTYHRISHTSTIQIRLCQKTLKWRQEESKGWVNKNINSPHFCRMRACAFSTRM